jgi:hypothetical protein
VKESRKQSKREGVREEEEEEEEEGKERGRERVSPGTRYPQEPTSSDLLAPARPYLLKFLEPSKIDPSSWDQAFNT